MLCPIFPVVTVSTLRSKTPPVVVLSVVAASIPKVPAAGNVTSTVESSSNDQ